LNKNPLSFYCKNSFNPITISPKLKRPRAPFTPYPWCPWIRVHTSKGVNYLYPPYEPEEPIVTYNSPLISRVMHFLVRPGFYHNLFMRKLWSLLWKTVVRQQGLPKLPIEEKNIPQASIEEMSTDILIVGGEPFTHILVATILEEVGEKEVIVLPQSEYAIPLNDNIPNNNVTRDTINLDKTVYLGKFDDGYLAINRENGLVYKIESKAVIFATGFRDAYPIFANNDLPGIISSHLAIKLYRENNCFNKKKIAVLGDNPWADTIASKLSNTNDVFRINKHDKNMFLEALELEALGYPKLEKIKVKNGGREQVIEADALISAIGFHPNLEALLQIGLKPVYSSATKTIVIKTKPGGETNLNDVFVTGYASGSSIATLKDDIVTEARFIGIRLGGILPNTILKERVKEIYRKKQIESFDTIIREKPWFWYSNNLKKLQFICPCEDLTVKDIVQTYEKGFNNLEKIKRYSAFGTGPCQGKICQINTAILLSYLSRKPLSEIGLYRVRPPLEPIELAYFPR
jgi:thioredoxin reductase